MMAGGARGAPSERGRRRRIAAGRANGKNCSRAQHASSLSLSEASAAAHPRPLTPPTLFASSLAPPPHHHHHHAPSRASAAAPACYCRGARQMGRGRCAKRKTREGRSPSPLSYPLLNPLPLSLSLVAPSAVPPTHPLSILLCSLHTLQPPPATPNLRLQTARRAPIHWQPTTLSLLPPDLVHTHTALHQNSFHTPTPPPIAHQSLPLASKQVKSARTISPGDFRGAERPFLAAHTLPPSLCHQTNPPSSPVTATDSHTL